jgi:hypothetical protein
MPGGPPTDNQNIDIKNGCLFVNRGRIFGTRLADKTGGSQDRSPRDLGPDKVTTVHKMVIEYIVQDLNVIRTGFLTKFL